MRRALLVLFAILAFACPAFAAEPKAEFALGQDEVYAGLPFVLELRIHGFDETPAPVHPPLALAGATVTPLDTATPQVSQSIQIFGGRRSETRTVTWSLRWRVEVAKAGRIRVPETEVVQGTKRAVATGGNVEVQAIASADDMSVELSLPSRPVYVGETVPVTLTWTFRRSPQDQTITIPMLASDAFVVAARPPEDARRTLTLAAGAKDLSVGYEVDQPGGGATKRLTATILAAPRRAGTIDIAPSSVVAALAIGRADFFGNAPTKLFRAVDVARKLEVRALPETNRPATFAGAVGEQFSISTRTSRSVVSLGEPVELEIAIRSDQSLETLSLGRLDGEGRLPKDKFTAPAEPPTGELSDDGRTKTFTVVAQVTGPATEIPAIAFSYFDPKAGEYRTIRSDPIALSVKGGSFVGAADVVAAKPSRSASPSAVQETTLVGADLALSAPGAADEAPLSGFPLTALVTLLYAIPVAVFATVAWRHRTQGDREEKAEIRAARRRVEELLAAAESRPARDVAGPLGAALRDLARVVGAGTVDEQLLARIETESFAPAAASQPLSQSIRADAESLVRSWMTKRAKAARTLASIAILAFVAGSARASPHDDGRAAYQQAMTLTTDATARRAAFSRAEIALAEAVRATPGRPELLADWGNAALGAGDVATATLAYRRALALDSGNPRARHNLAWLRSRQADAFRPADGSAADTLLFFHAWPRPRRLVAGGAAFAIAVLLLVPWAGRRRRALTPLALVAGAVWLSMLGSVVLEDRRADDAVVLDDVVLRAADSAGAPAALSQPLPRGVEVTLLEQRDAWSHVRVASGVSGWVPSGAVRRIAE